MPDRITDEEREMIDSVVSAGRVSRLPAQVRAPTPDPVGQIAQSCPARRVTEVPKIMGVQAALEWAFSTECAQMDAVELDGVSGAARGKAMSAEAVLLSRAALGATVDTSVGRSSPADDAEVIASVLRGTAANFSTAVWVADLARARRTPDWMEDETPRIAPVDWCYGRGGARGKTLDSSTLGGGGWPHQVRRSRKGGIIRVPVMFTPCRWSITAQQIRQVRQDYLAWWETLLWVGGELRGIKFDRFTVSDEMPPLRPWAL